MLSVDIGCMKLTASDFMTFKPASVDAHVPIIIAAKVMSHKGFRHLPVVEPDASLVGIVTALDVVNALGGGSKYRSLVTQKHGGNLPSALMDNVATIMSKQVCTLPTRDFTLSKLVQLMVDANKGYVVGVEGGQPAWISTLRNITLHMGRKEFGVKVGQVMTRELVTVQANQNLLGALKLMCARDIRRLLVFSDRTLNGILTATDILRFATSGRGTDLLKNGRFHTTPIADVATRGVTTTPDDVDIGEAAQVLHNYWIGSLAVKRGEDVVGIVTERDLVHKGFKILYQRFISTLTA